jgi:hypothetical protein
VEALLEILRTKRLQEVVDADMKKPRHGFPPGAHFVSFDFPSRPFQ